MWDMCSCQYVGTGTAVVMCGYVQLSVCGDRYSSRYVWTCTAVGMRRQVLLSVCGDRYCCWFVGTCTAFGMWRQVQLSVCGDWYCCWYVGKGAAVSMWGHVLLSVCGDRCSCQYVGTSMAVPRILRTCKELSTWHTCLKSYFAINVSILYKRFFFYPSTNLEVDNMWHQILVNWIQWSKGHLVAFLFT